MTHLDRKELKRPDAFLLRAEEIVAFINENSRMLMGILAVLFVMGVGVVLFNEMRERKNEVAASRYFGTQKALKTALSTVPKTEKDWNAKVEKQIADVERFAKENKGTESAFQALLLLGDTYYERGNGQKASEYYAAAVSASPSAKVRQLAELALGYAEESSGKYAEAIAHFEKLANGDDKTLRSDAMMSLARNYALKGDKTKAAETYDKTAREFPNTPTARLAETQKASLGG